MCSGFSNLPTDFTTGASGTIDPPNPTQGHNRGGRKRAGK